MGKEVTSVSIEGELKDWFQENYPEVSLSSVVEQVVREMQETGRRPDGLEFKREMLERELEMYEQQATQARKQLERLEEIEDDRQSTEAEAEELAKELAESRSEPVQPENPAIQHQSASVGVPPGELAEMVNANIDTAAGLKSV